jgi:uncharacterized protein YbjT (DUF2867 family)
MNVLIFGATGMVGRGVLRECLLDPGVMMVRSVSRTATGVHDPKLRETLHGDLSNCAPIEADLAGFDACFFTLGVSAAGMKQKDYEKITYDLTLAVASTLSRLNPKMTFIYVSGAGTDSTEKGSTMWARVKGKTENALLRLPFSAYMFRPGMIQPMHGEAPKAAFYKAIFLVFKPLWPVLRRVFPNHVLTTEEIGRGMLAVVRHGYKKPVLEIRDIHAVLQPSLTQ